MKMTMGKAISIFFGVVALFGPWIYFFETSKDKEFQTEIFILVLIALVFALAYSLLHQQRYPIQTLAVVLVVEFLLLAIFGQNSYDRVIVGTYMYGVNMIGGSIFAILGPVMARGFTKVCLPLQTRLRKEGIRLSIPVVAGLIAFIVCFPLLAVRL